MATTEAPPTHWLVQDFERLQYLHGSAREKFRRHLDYAAGLEIRRINQDFYDGDDICIDGIDGLVNLLSEIDELNPLYCRECGAPQPREDGEDEEDVVCDECASGTWLDLQRHWADYPW